jgi:predicted PurR-regulated permease PerM
VADSFTRAVVRVVVIVIVSVVAVYVIYLLRRPIGWLVIAGFLAVAMAGPVNLLQRHMRRGLAIAIAYLVLFMIPIALGAILVPSIVRAVNDLADNVPTYVTDLQDYVNKNEKLRKINDDYEITDKLKEQSNKLPSKLGGAAGTLAKLGSGLVSGIFAAVTILILSIFMVSRGREWVEAFLALQSPDSEARLRRMIDRSSRAVGAYVAGALLQATIAGVTTFIVLKLLGVPFAAALAVVVFFFDLIPLVGATIGSFVVIAAAFIFVDVRAGIAMFIIVTVFNDFPVDTIIWVVWAIVYQQVENTVIQPRIQSRAVNIQPFIVLVAVLFGSTLFGIPGALLAIPAAASIQIAVYEYWQYRKEIQALHANPPVHQGPAEAPT